MVIRPRIQKSKALLEKHVQKTFKKCKALLAKIFGKFRNE
jgi:hypothetical protein